MTRISCWLFVFTLALGACTSDRDRFSSRTQKMEADAYNVKCGDGKCDPVVEDCGKCPQDCKGPCTGCQVKVTPGCTGCACEKCVCAKDPTCCNKVWDSVCVTHCKACSTGCGLIPEAGMPDLGGDLGPSNDAADLSPPQPDGTPDLGPPVCGNGNCEPWGKEDCDSCAKDCNYDKKLKKAKPCDGCQPKFKPGCKGCKCETCVCTTDPWCCLMYWDRDCVKLCKFSCKGGCGLTGTDMGTPDQALPDGFGLKCGDNTCVEGKEFCDTCPEDCGKCTGCKVKKKAGCKGCKCETEVCKKMSGCCSSGWGNDCVLLCKTSTLGCGQIPDLGPDLPQVSDKGVDTTDMSEDAILAQYDMNYQGDGYNKNLTDWRSNPAYWEAGANYKSSKWGTGCNCEVIPTRPPPYLFLLLLGGVLVLARRRK